MLKYNKILQGDYMKNSIGIFILAFVFLALVGCTSYPEYSYRKDFSQLEQGKVTEIESRIYESTLPYVHRTIVKSIVHFLKCPEAIAKNIGDIESKYERIVASGLATYIFLYPLDDTRPMRYEIIYKVKNNKELNIIEYPERAFIETKHNKDTKKVEVVLTILKNKNNKKDIVPFTIQSFLDEVSIRLKK